MKSFKILLLTGVLLISQLTFAITFIANSNQVYNSFSIIMEDDIFMRADSGDQNDPIIEVKLIKNSEEVFTNNSCTSQVCVSDLSGLESGVYNVEVNTINNTFCGIVEVK